MLIEAYSRLAYDPLLLCEYLIYEDNDTEHKSYLTSYFITPNNVSFF